MATPGWWIAPALCIAAPLLAQQRPEVPEHVPPDERIHTVRPGDTLWGIAHTYLRDPFLRPQIFQLNAGVIRDPSRIFPDLGAAMGIRVGDEFAAYLPPRRLGWGTVPGVEVARLQVIRVGERTSAMRVISMNHPALAPGLAVRRVARMP